VGGLERNEHLLVGPDFELEFVDVALLARVHYPLVQQSRLVVIQRDNAANAVLIKGIAHAVFHQGGRVFEVANALAVGPVAFRHVYFVRDYISRRQVSRRVAAGIRVDISNRTAST
jgi:hypothetical protein